MEAIARRVVLVGEHTTSVTRSIFKQQDQIVRDKYTRHLENANVIYPHRLHTPDFSNEANEFFKNLAKKKIVKSVLQNLEDKIYNERSEIYRIIYIKILKIKHKRNESPYCLNCIREENRQII
ncbi:unnamed protein product [Rhizophagus irregularis]|uniref:Uncharacterized protein n=1 Tax=Rhizophagus irregularis TaxID=588596 RepID=A0A915ZXF2_9GLOM|nr:unnamed protein product [Rhizophagus irregularis]GBC38811.2 hypothetical protein RIR_jg4123.t1 [Rhizophagus irregularis DAOM 181602=DAOM 197198]CAB4460282.1 unnamed protein product [Rhizophagus irregularis]CAB5163369.1 unnamed protein product [Rhizophagus irregularis]CAB5380145.1 unnamed protein product [Rhizophagus irregularis]